MDNEELPFANATTVTATLTERGQALPDVGEYVQDDDDGAIYIVVVEGSYIEVASAVTGCKLREIEWNAAESVTPNPCRVEIE